MATTETVMPAGEFKARCLKLMDQVRATGRPIVITKRGKPVARLVPVADETASLFGRMRGEIAILGDIVGPTGEEWNAEKGILHVEAPQRPPATDRSGRQSRGCPGPSLLIAKRRPRVGRGCLE